jgi:hypothetical protein
MHARGLPMKAVVLNGAGKGDHATDAVHGILRDELSGIGCEVESFTLRELEISPCLGCFGCWVQTPGVCVIRDVGRDVARAIIRSDLAVFLTPVTFGGYSSELKKVLDRSIGLVSPFFTRVKGEIHHKRRYPRHPRLIGVGVLAKPDPESERIFTSLVNRNAINFFTPAHAAGVVLIGEGTDRVREKVSSLIAAVGVRR